MFILLILMFFAGVILQCIINLILGIIYRMKIAKILETINAKEDLLFLDCRDFVNLVAEVFRRKGCVVEITDKCGEDGNGLIINGTKLAEVWKHGPRQAVNVEAGMKLAKCMSSNSIYKGMLITLGNFKPITKHFCYANVIECVGGERLLQMCKEVQRKVPLQQVQ